MKIKTILTAFLLTICFNAHSQIYYAGQNLSVYVDINPDTLIHYTCSFSGSVQDYYFDVNGDLLNDFKVEALCSVAMGGTTADITITPLSPDANIRFGRLDSVYNSSVGGWWVTKIAQPLQYGDSINSNTSKWENGLYLTDNSNFFSGPPKNVTDWVSTNDAYIGIKYQNFTDTIYGWIRVKCPSAGGCYLKDYSLGGGALSINEFRLGAGTIYPNPAADKIYIERSNNDEMTINFFDVVGKQIKEVIKSKNQKTEINLCNMSEGLYFIRIKTAKGTCTKKIIIAR